MHYNQHTLPNGLRIIHKPSLSKVAYCGFAVDAGTRDEADNEQGMAHFVEHIIFKGTENLAPYWSNVSIAWFSSSNRCSLVSSFFSSSIFYNFNR